MVFKSSPPNLHAVCRGLELKDFEHYNSVKGPSFSIEPTTARWKPPLTNFIKLNVDATWKKQHSSIAVIAKDSKGDILGAWAKEQDMRDATSAKAAAIKWALELTQLHEFSYVMVERDAKVCIDALLGIEESTNWSILALCYDIKFLALNFVNCDFVWAKREANSVAHELAKLVSPLSSSFNSNQATLPPSVLEAWQRDTLGFPLDFS